MVTSMSKEIALRTEFMANVNIETIYFGGGTPSLLTSTDIELLLNTINKYYRIESNAEITLEANPDDINMNKLTDWKSLGFNRLSVGVQTFNDDMLKFINRAHNSGEALMAIDNVRAAGFNNFNIDLIYALPSDGHSILKKDLDQFMNIMPPHISAYHLTIEEGTVFGNWHKKGKLREHDDEFTEKQYQLVAERLKEEGYDHYEVSNYGLPQYQAVHNSNYWKGKPYLGIGPGAHGYNGNFRYANVRNNPQYIRGVEENMLISNIEYLQKQDKINEYLLTQLRTRWGIDLNLLQKEFSYELNDDRKIYLKNIESRGLGTFEESKFVLNEQGFLLADQIALDLCV